MDSMQIDMARHALGLPNANRRSYRNYYVASFGTVFDIKWSELVQKGLAERGGGRQFVGYCLTHKGAQIAVMAGETLDPEDFPSQLSSSARSSEEKP